MHVAGNGAVCGLAGGEAGDLHVLAHGVDELGECRLNGLALQGLLEERVDISGVRLGNDLGNGGGKTGELGVGAHEVGLAGNLAESAGGSIIGNERAYGTLVGLAAGLLGGSGKAVLAEDVNSGIHVAVSLDERLLALHHGGIGHLAELLDLGGGNVGHHGPFL